MYENLPIFKKAIELNLYVEDIVKNFSRYNKYSIGSELREKSRAILYAIYKVYFAKKKIEALENLRNYIEELKIIIFLAKELKSLKSLRQFSILSKLAYDLAKQVQGWLNSQNSQSSFGSGDFSPTKNQG